MKAFKITVSVLVIVALVAMIAVMIFVKAPASNEELTLEETNIPDYENTFGFMPKELPTDKKELIQLAARMYDVANQNIENLDKVAFLIKYNSTVYVDIGVAKMDVPVQGYRYQLKNGTEFYASEYSIPGEGGLGSIAGQFAKENSNFSLRAYADVTKSDYMFSEKSYTPKIITDGTTGELTIKSDFSDGNLVSESKWARKQPVPYYCSAQSERYYAANRSMSENNILSATIEYHRSLSGNYYRLELELDVNKEETWERTIDELRNGTAADAHYTKMTEIFEIWENGYYKSFRSLDNSAWKNGAMSMEFDYFANFHYDTEHTTPSYYQNFTEAKEKALVYFEENK